MKTEERINKYLKEIFMKTEEKINKYLNEKNVRSYYFQVSIDVKKNDPVDIRSGGPHYEGFDFKIYQAKGLTKGTVTKYLQNILRKLNVPFEHLLVEKKEFVGPKWWSFEEIEEEIRKHKGSMY